MEINEYNVKKKKKENVTKSSFKESFDILIFFN